MWQRIEHKSFKDDCTVPLSDLRYLHVLHVDLDGTEHEGEMVCNKAIADDVLDILRQLYEADFPYKIDHDDLCYQLFVAHGFEWGGDWEDRKDYQHFEMPDDVVAELYPEWRAS